MRVVVVVVVVVVAYERLRDYTPENGSHGSRLVYIIDLRSYPGHDPVTDRASECFFLPL